jgi:hypothetical protein
MLCLPRVCPLDNGVRTETVVNVCTTQALIRGKVLQQLVLAAQQKHPFLQHLCLLRVSNILKLAHAKRQIALPGLDKLPEPACFCVGRSIPEHAAATPYPGSRNVQS